MDDDSCAFVDEEERHFYTVLPDLSPYVVAGGAGGGEGDAKVGADRSDTASADGKRAGKNSTREQGGGGKGPSAKKGSASPPGGGSTATGGSSSSPRGGAQANGDVGGNGVAGGGTSALESLLSTVVAVDSSDKADRFSALFVSTPAVGHRSAGKRLGRALFLASPTNLNILPYLARVAATLNPYAPDVATTLLGLLDDEFRALASRKDRDARLLETRVRNARFLGQLSNFRLVPSTTIFFYLNLCLADFTHHNVDVACHLLETAGRALLHTPATSLRTNNTLDIMWRLKAVRNLQSRHEAMVEAAYYTCRGDPSLRFRDRPREPMREYLNHLLLGSQLTADSAPWTASQLRKLPWDADLDRYVVRKMRKAERLRFPSLRALVRVLIMLRRPEVTILLADALVEAVRVGLEMNDSRLNQRRVAEVVLFAELTVARIVPASCLLETLYEIISHPSDDPSGDYFRVRLVCEVLKVAGPFLIRATRDGLRRMDVFLSCFDRYLLAKVAVEVAAEWADALPGDSESPQAAGGAGTAASSGGSSGVGDGVASIAGGSSPPHADAAGSSAPAPIVDDILTIDMFARLPLHVRFIVDDGLSSISGGSLSPRARSLADAVAAVERVEATPALAALVQLPNYALPPVPAPPPPQPPAPSVLGASAVGTTASGTEVAAKEVSAALAADATGSTSPGSVAVDTAAPTAPASAADGAAEGSADREGDSPVPSAAASPTSAVQDMEREGGEAGSSGSDSSSDTSAELGDADESDDGLDSGQDSKDDEEYGEELDEDVDSNASDVDLDDPADDDDEEDDEEEEDDDEEDDDDDDDDDDDEDDESDVELTNVPVKVVRTEEEEEFDRELASVQKEAANEAWLQAKGTSASVNRMALPLRLFTGTGSSAAATGVPGASGEPPAVDTVDVNGVASVKLKLLVRKGGKSHSKELAVPAESSLAAAARDGDVAGRAEQLEVKRLVLGSAAVMSPDSDDDRDDGGYGAGGGGRGSRGRRSERPQQYDERYLLTGMFKFKR